MVAAAAYDVRERSGCLHFSDHCDNPRVITIEQSSGK
jgi:hypothetical protein